MANLGIVIAVSDYMHNANNLPACIRDGTVIEEVLRLSGRFDDVLYIYHDTKSTNVKQRLAEFIKSHHEEEIGEVIFYLREWPMTNGVFPPACRATIATASPIDRVA
jgi:hypothetical protein